MQELKSKSLHFKLVESDDAEFILSLRADETYNKYLSPVEFNLKAQLDWLYHYKKREKKNDEFYFVIVNANHERCGTVRLYDFRQNSFCWGSWILNDKKPQHAAIQSAFLVYEFGFKVLNFEESHFDVRKENLNVIDFHKRMGAEIFEEDRDNFYFKISSKKVQLWSQKYERFLK